MKKLFLAFFVTCLLAACSKDNGSSAWEDQTSACLKNFDYQYETLLTKADVSKHTEIDEPSYKLDIGAVKGRYGYCEYIWDSDRPNLTLEVAGHIVETGDYNRVNLTLLHFYEADEVDLYNQASVLALFEAGYKELSDAEVQAIIENFEKEYADDPEGLEQAEKLLEKRLQFDYQRIDQLGTRAYWSWDEKWGGELNVLTGSTSFSLRTKLSADAETTLPLAIAMAKEVLAKCN